MTEPTLGTIWQHYKGEVYQIIGHSWCVMGDKLIRRVHYQKPGIKGWFRSRNTDLEPPIFSRTVENFLEAVPNKGPRFKLKKP